MRIAVLSAIVLSLAGASCGGARPPAPATSPAAAVDVGIEKVALADVGLDASKLDRAADPCDDFYRYACGGWLDRTQIPPDKPVYGTFNEIADRNEALLHDLLEKASSAPGDDPVLQKIGGFYGACMDEAAVEKLGLTPIEPLLAPVRQVKDVPTLLAAVAALQLAGVDVLFGIGPQQDKLDATQVIAQVYQGGQGLPDRETYLGDDPKLKEVRAAYLAHVEKMLALAGHPAAEAQRGAADILAIETDLARASKTPVELRDEKGTYNRVDRAGLAGAAPRLPWERYLEAVGLTGVQKINAPAPKFVAALNDVAPRYKPAQWRAYLEEHVLEAYALALPKRFVDESFEMQRVLTGQKEQRVRWKRCVAATDADLGMLLAQPYVAAAFPGDSKKAAEATVRAIVDAFADNLRLVAWMDDATRVKAAAKLRKMEFLIGYPDTWRRYEFPIDRGNAGANALAGTRAEVRRQLDKIGRPLDRHDWEITPQTVNAYYEPPLNQMVFPAGILQRPFYDARSAPPVNYGAMGMIVGHELTHGFDDQGAQFDGDGNLSGWWPPAVTQAFEEKTQCVAQAYSRYEVLPGLHLNGELTNGENIADIGGVKMAFAAYRALHRPPRTADGFSEDQQFFLGLGQAWCEKRSDQFTRLTAAIDPHSPGRFRILGVVSNLPAFAEAFHCPVGSPMHPSETCQAW
jgi:predicted metalloendopeptidase